MFAPQTDIFCCIDRIVPGQNVKATPAAQTVVALVALKLVGASRRSV